VSKTVVLTGVGRDRVGIVAELTQVLFELGGNLLDSSMTLLRGEFALILMVELSERTSLDDLEAGLLQLENQLGMKIHVRELAQDELNEPVADRNSFIVSVYGADKPGIVAAVTRALAHNALNITDVQTKSTGHADKIFLMILEVSSSTATMSVSDVERNLKSIGDQLSVDISVQALDVVEL